MKIAIVTGASSGMGREFVRQLSAYVQVDEIWAIARRREALRAQLIKYGYVREEWRSYEEYLCANLSGGLAGAIEARSAEGN